MITEDHEFCIARLKFLIKLLKENPGIGRALQQNYLRNYRRINHEESLYSSLCSYLQIIKQSKFELLTIY